MARGMDDAEVKNGDIPHLAVTICDAWLSFRNEGDCYSEMRNVPILQDTARGYEPSTRNSDARFLSAANAFATCGSSA